MAMAHGSNSLDQTSGIVERDINVLDHDAGRSNYIAFVLGGLMISVGLLAFALFDSGAPSMGRDVITTGSIMQSAPSTGEPARSGSGSSLPGRLGGIDALR